MPKSVPKNPGLNDDLRDENPDERNSEADEDRRIEADNEFYDGDQDQVKQVFIR